MGCGSSSPKDPETAALAVKSVGIDRNLEEDRKEEASKIKMLLLGAGDSGKSTIFKQMRLLYGAPRSDDELRMYGVVVRSNVVVTMRKLVFHLRTLGLEDSLDREAAGPEGGPTPREAYNELNDALNENAAATTDPTATAQDAVEAGDAGGKQDWVGQNRLAGLAANNDAKQFLAHHEAIQILWQVRNICGCSGG